jgi:predicted DNA-binding protein
MANSPLVSIRIPPETLERIDQLALKLYPARRTGKKPNRSQVILEAIEQFLAQHERVQPPLTVINATELDATELDATVIQEVVSPEPDQDGLSGFVSEEETSYAGLHIPELLISQEDDLADQLSSFATPWDGTSPPTEEELNTDISSARKYIDWWLNYFSYMSKFTKPWFISSSARKSS